jgi:hypothetical protein
MKYRVTVDLAFDAEADARAVFNAAKTKKALAGSLNAGESPRIELHQCGHDEVPLQPCVVIDSVEFPA